MKYFPLWLLTVLFALGCLLSGCAGNRVLVKNCQDLVGMGDQKNCELVRKL